MQMENGKQTEAIAIGASAGGVEAVGHLLQAIPRDFQPAILIVLHLPSDRITLLPKIYSKKCARPVKEAEDKEPILPGTAYVAAPDYHLLVEPDKSLSLTRDNPVHHSRPAIDVLFESAAMAYKDRLLGIILTGANSDGAEGLKAVRACGGAAWVQHPSDASSPIMPEAAIACAGADAILTIREMAERLSVCSADSSNHTISNHDSN